MTPAPLRPARLQFDNQGTVVSRDFDDIYFTADGLAESRYVFLQGNRLATRFATHPRPLFIVAETGFGCGLNFLALWQAFDQFRRAHPQAPLQRLHFISFEKHPLTAEDLHKTHSLWPELSPFARALQQQWPLALPGCQRLLFDQGRVSLDLWLGDINDSLPLLDASCYQQIDAWFLDGFAPAKNPDMWSPALFAHLARLTRQGGTLATFSAAGIVRRGLQQAGFQTEKRQGFARKREMLTAWQPPAPRPPDPYPGYQRLAVPHGDIAIIGGGIASALLALALLRRGRSVCLYCADPAPAQGASGNRQGALYPLLSRNDPAIARFFPAAFSFARRLYDKLAVNVEHQWCGVIQLAYHPSSLKKISQWLSLDLPFSLAHALSASQVSARCGLPLAHGGISYPTGGWINPAQLTATLLALARQQGLRTHYCHQAQHLTPLPHCGGWQIQFSRQPAQQHAVLVLANGWQISQFSQTADLPVTPAAGQVSHIPTTPTLAKLRQVLCYDGYLTPHNPASGWHCLGATYRRGETATDYRPRDQADNRQQLITALGQSPFSDQIDISAGQGQCAVRCLVRDHLPLVGNAPDKAATLAQPGVRQPGTPHPDLTARYHDNLFILAGFGSRGLCSAPLAAEILAAQINGEPLPLDAPTLNALNPNRVWMRKYQKPARRPETPDNH